MTHAKIKLQIWCDTQCPYGLWTANNLMEALSKFPHAQDVEIDFLSYILMRCDVASPYDSRAESAPEKEEIEWVDGISEVFKMSKSEAATMLSEITKKTSALGMNLDFERAKVKATRPSHRMVQYLRKQAKEQNLHWSQDNTMPWVLAVMSASFEQGKDISDLRVLVEIAKEFGIEEAQAEKIFTSTEFDAQIEADIAAGKAQNIERLPFFLVNGTTAVAGPNEAEDFLRIFNDAWEKQVAEVGQ